MLSSTNSLALAAVSFCNINVMNNIFTYFKENSVNLNFIFTEQLKKKKRLLCFIYSHQSVPENVKGLSSSHGVIFGLVQSSNQQLCTSAKTRIDSSQEKLLWTLSSITKLSVRHSGSAVLLRRMRGVCYERQADPRLLALGATRPWRQRATKYLKLRDCPTRRSASTGVVSSVSWSNWTGRPSLNSRCSARTVVYCCSNLHNAFIIKVQFYINN